MMVRLSMPIRAALERAIVSAAKGPLASRVRRALLTRAGTFPKRKFWHVNRVSAETRKADAKLRRQLGVKHGFRRA